MGEEGRVGILMCAGCAFVCLLLFVTLALTQVAMQDRRLVSCADALAGAGVGGASASSVLVGQTSGTDEAGASSHTEGSPKAPPGTVISGQAPSSSAPSASSTSKAGASGGT